MMEPRELIKRMVEIQDLYLRLNPGYVQYENDPGRLIELLMQVRKEAKEYLSLSDTNQSQQSGSIADDQLEGIAHEIWACAQLIHGEGITDGVDRVVNVLKREIFPESISALHVPG